MNEPLSYLSTVAVIDALQASWDFLLKGGLFMIPLAVAAFIGMAAIVFKLLSLARSRVIPSQLAAQLENFGKLMDPAQQQAMAREIEAGGSTLARLSGVALRHRNKPQRDIILAVESSAREEASRLHAGIGILDIVITVAPLLGLLGTASGLVTIFQGLSDSADHLAIARGIATTFGGVANDGISGR